MSGDDERLLFAYGSNMASRVLRRVCPSAEAVMRADLPNHRIAFRRYSTAFGGGVCTIEAAPGQLVRGVVYRVGGAELLALDCFGDLGSGLYCRQTFLVLGEDRTWHEADLHRAVRPGGPFPPAPGYVELMLEGAREHDLGHDYVTLLAELLGAGSRRAAEGR
jgi:gamma-glutamylcyclotransferase (GGCT)/AIG2-like uncharacterized protein YtfP